MLCIPQKEKYSAIRFRKEETKEIDVRLSHLRLFCADVKHIRHED